MKRKMFLLVLIVSLLLSVMAVASALALGRYTQTAQDLLGERVLQAADLEGAERIYYEDVTADSLPGPLSPANVVLQTPGFQRGYRVGTYCVVQQGKFGFYVLNIVYQFQNADQARAALEQQLEFYRRPESYAGTDLLEGVKIVPVEGIDRYALDKGIVGRAYSVYYNSEGMDWETSYFHGVKDDTLIFLMMHSVPSATSQQWFGALVEKTLQRQE